MSSSPLIIGLTGGIASGKSQVCKIFAELGIKIIDSDQIAKELFDVNSPHLTTLRNRFGNDIFFADKSLDRKALGNIVFSDPEQLNWLNNFTHPLIFNEIKQQLSLATSDYVIIDIPLLIDSNGDVSTRFAEIIDRILVINTSAENQLKRLLLREDISPEQAHKIINSQSSLEQKLKLADDIIDNNASIENLKTQVEKVHKKYLLLLQTL